MTLRVHECRHFFELGGDDFFSIPRYSMYGQFTYMWLKCLVNVYIHHTLSVWESDLSKQVQPKQQKLKAHQRDALRVNVRRSSRDSTGAGSTGPVGAEGGVGCEQ